MDKYTKEDAAIDCEGNKGEAIEAMIKAGCSYKEAMGYWKIFGSKTNSRGFKPTFYGWLREGERSMKEVGVFVKETGSDNDYRYLKLFEGIAELANSIHRDLSE